jgi:large subunit ribosomal protein L5
MAAASTSAASALRAGSLRTLTSNLSPHRYADHYHRVLAPDLLYLTYDHSPAPSSLVSPTQRKADQIHWDPTNPYTKNRPAKKPKGNQALTPATRIIKPDNVVRLEEIVLNTFVKEATANKNQLLTAIAGFQAMTGEPIPGYASDGSKNSTSGIQIARTTRASASFKVRAGMVCGVKVSLKGEAMWSFLETLVDLVLPRMKDWNGVRLPPPSVNKRSPSSTGGVVSFGLSPAAMGLFPGVEVNLEQYPRLHGFNIQFITNAKGLGAQDQARALLSGFRVPL